jgi:putative peptidoglycan lipid II flippase
LPPEELKATQNRRSSLGKTFGIVAALTVLSKCAGLIRDMVVLSAYGTTVLADAYNYAYLFTGNILVLFGGLGGPFHSATVTTLTPKKDAPGSGVLMTQVMVATFLILAVVAVLLYVLAPLLVHLLAGGYGHNEADRQQFFRETIMQLRVMSPLVVIAGLIGVSYGILNVYDKIFWPSLSPALASLAIVIALFVCPDRNSAWPLAFGTLIGAICQLGAQIPGMLNCNLKYKLSFQLSEGLKDYTSMLWPAVFGTSIGQLTIYVDSWFSSKIGEGAWTAVINANRLVQLPLGVLITAMLVPVLPRFTQQASSKKNDALKDEFRRALRFLWFLSMPLTAVLLVIPRPIIQLLFQRGAFNEESTTLVTTALLFLVPSIVFYVGRDLITRVFYSLQDSKTPYYIAIVAIFLKAFLDWFFIFVMHLGVGGISLATTAVTIVNLLLLSTLLHMKIGPLGLSRLIGPVSIMTIGAIAAGFIAYESAVLITAYLHTSTLFRLLLTVAVPGMLAVGTYAFICTILRLEEPALFAKRFLTRESIIPKD